MVGGRVSRNLHDGSPMTRKPTRVIGFFDLLGTREYARNEPERFKRGILTFKESVEHAASELSGQDTVFLFSDCAYFESAKAERAVAFVAEVRMSLLLQGFYMKGAIGLGRLGAINALSTPSSGVPKSKSSGRQIVRGHTFEGEVVDIYSSQDTLKGIGIRVQTELVQRLERRGTCVNSCHLPDKAKREGMCFVDLKFRPSEMDAEIFRFIVADFFVSATRSSSFGRYYVTLLITWIRSCDFESRDGQVIDAAADETVRFLLDRTFEKNVSRLPGSELMYYALLDRVYTELGRSRNSNKVVNKVQEFISTRRWLISRLETVPVCIFSRESRGTLLAHLSGSIKPESKPVVKSQDPPPSDDGTATKAPSG